jgi:hypothetical protein
MTLPQLIRVRGIDSKGMIRYSRVYQQSPAAHRYAAALELHGYVVRLEQARDVEFTLVGGLNV